MNRYSPIAATLILAAVLIPLLMPPGTSPTYATNVIYAPEGGRLDALDRDGQVMGPCPLRHTDVEVSISAFFSRVHVTQRFQNTYADKIEAVYTFPLSHRAAVDRMTMTIGDRVIVGEVHERQRARRMYEAAREQGYVASLLEQERPNIFTQSVANIEPGAEVTIDISYVEMLESKDGLYSFDFPMVVGPRYIPGSMTGASAVSELPAGLKRRGGITLMAPAALTIGDAGDTSKLGTLQSGRLDALLQNAVPISVPDATWWAKLDSSGAAATSAAAGREPGLWYRFEAVYPNGAKERGTLHTDGTGQINGRWFYVNPQASVEPGTGFSPNTDRVPDAAKITPMPVKPDKRAGHDISLRVTIDTGGPGILAAKSELHDVVRTASNKRDDGNPRKLTLELMKSDEIPNRDFILNWRQTADTIQEATFTHTDKNGKFFTLIVQPPDRVTDEQAVPREMIFVLDSSGSMSGFPIEKAKEVMSKAIDTLRPRDTFNLITFSGDTRILWDKPRPFNQANRDEAQAFLAARQGSGGTEMMKAINAALIQTAGSVADAITLEKLADVPADGRAVSVRLDWSQYTTSTPNLAYKVEGDRSPISFGLKNGAAIEAHIPASGMQQGDIAGLKTSVLTGKWLTSHGHAMLVVDQVDWIRPPTEGPVRICCFMTDGYVGNDMEIIDAVRRNAHTTRVFSFGIGNSVNRYLLDNMAKAGRGEVEYVQVKPGTEPQAQPGGRDDAAEQAVARFTKRIQTPVLMDVSLAFSEGLEVTDLVPAEVPDLYDVKPLVLHGRYTKPGKGTLTIRGRSGAGPYQRVLNLDLPDTQPEHDTIATLWARARVESIMNQDLAAAQKGAFPQPLKNQIIDLGERFGIMTQFTSFVAVEKARVTIGGQPRLVAVPIEMPQGVSYEGIFGSCIQGTASADSLSKDCLREVRFAAKVAERQENRVHLEKFGKPVPPSTTAPPASDKDVLANAKAETQRLRELEEKVQRLSRDEQNAPAGQKLVAEREASKANLDKLLVELNNRLSNVAALVIPAAPSPQQGQTTPATTNLSTLNKSQEQAVMLNRLAAKSEGKPGSLTAESLNEEHEWRVMPGKESRQKALEDRNRRWGDASDSLAIVDQGQANQWAYFSRSNALSFDDADGDGLQDAYGDFDQLSYGYQAGNGNVDLYYRNAGVPGLQMMQTSLADDDTVRLQIQPQTLTTSSYSIMANVPAQEGAANGGFAEVEPSLESAPGSGGTTRPAARYLLLPSGVTMSGKQFVCPSRGTLKDNTAANRKGELTDVGTLVIAGDKEDGELAEQLTELFNFEPVAQSVHLAKQAATAPAASQPSTQPAQAAIPAPTGPVSTRPAAPSASEEMTALLTTLGTDQGRAWAARTLLRERLVLLVAALVKEGRIDDARELADALAAFAPDFTAGVQMAKVLADAAMTPAERDKQIAALADEARKPIAAAVRHDKAMRRLHPELRKLAKSPETQPAAAGVADANADLMVTVLAKDTQPDTLAALKQAGFRVEAVADRAKLAVGRIAPDRLEEVAALDVVRKIDPEKP